MNDGSPDIKALCCVSYFVRQMMKFQRIARNLTRACLISSSIFSNKKKDKIHFHERQLHEIFKEITMEKGCLQNIIRLIRWINHLTMFNQSYSNILRITGSSFKSWRHLCIVRWSVLAIALKPVFSPFPNLRVLDTPLIQVD